MNPQQLAQVEALCEDLYNGPSEAKRRDAEAQLRVFGTSAEYIPRCQYILDNSSNQFALYLAATSLRNLMTTFWNHFTVDNRLEVRNYILTYLATNATSLRPFVTTAMIQLGCRITKLGWFDSDAHQEITTDITKFLEASATHCILGIQFLNLLIEEMDQAMPGKSLTFHRKTAVSFRDIALFRIFQISFTTLRQIPSYQSQASEDDVSKLQAQALILAKKCLSYDFLGTSVDDSTDDLGPLQVPKTWRAVIQDADTTKLFFNVYKNDHMGHGTLALECLAQLAQVRKSIFATETDRKEFLTRLLEGMNDVLHNKYGLNNPENYNEFVRMLSAVKANYQLNELASNEAYPDWIKLVADLTVESLRTLEWVVPGADLANGLYYLMTLWSKLVSSSSPYTAKSSTASQNFLDIYAPQVGMAYIEARVEAVGRGLLDDIDDDVDFDQDQTLFQAFPDICRCEYEKICQHIISLLDPRVMNFQSYLESYPRGSDVPPNVQQQKKQLDGELSWLMYIIGAIISTRVRSSHKDAYSLNDGNLSSRIFQLVRLSDQYHGPGADPRFEVALMYFFTHFRAAYIGGDQGLTASKVYQPLGELVGLKDHVSVLNVMVTRIGMNLKVWTDSKMVILKSLRLFKELAVGMSSATMLASLDSTKVILQNHASDHFPFLRLPGNFQARPLYYSTLGRLLFQHPCEQSKFDAFMAPFEQVLEYLINSPVRNDQDYVMALVGLFKDLRGLTAAAVNSRAYVMLFEWLYPRCFDLVVRSMEALSNNPNLSVPLLKFMAEVVHNRGSRINFSSSSPNGILLFREASKIISTVANNLPAHGVHQDVYQERYKPIWICLSILSRALTGAYVNLGVFALYNDPALDNGLNAALKLAVSLPQEDITAYRKVAREYYSFCEILAQYHGPFLWSLPIDVFAQLLSSLQAGVGSLDITVSSKSCSALDHLGVYQLKHIQKDNDVGRAVRTQVEAHRPIFGEILNVLFHHAVHEQCSNQWSLSRPMLTVLLTNESAFNEMKQNWAQGLSMEHQQKLAEAFDKLMSGISPALSTRTRDVFSRNFTEFRRFVKTFL